MKRLLCILVIIAFVCGGCASSPQITSYSWEPIVVTSPKPGKPFLSDQLIEQTNLIIADIEESLDYAEIETKAEADLVLRGLYGTHMMYSGNLKVAASKAKRNNAMVYGDSLDIISNLKSIEGRLLMEQKDFVPPVLSAADRFDETVDNFESMFLKLSQHEKTSVELVAFLMGAERVFSASRVWGDAARMEAELAIPETYHYLNQYPVFLDVILARFGDMYQTALEISNAANTTLKRQDVAQLIDKLWKIQEQLLHKLDKQEYGTVNAILFDNLETFGRVSKERANLTYASLRLALHSVIAGKLLEKVNTELGVIPTDVLSLAESDLPRTMDWFRDLSICSYHNAVRYIEDNYQLADTARWPISNLEIAHVLLTDDYMSDLEKILTLVEVIVSSELTVCALSLQSLVKADGISFYFEDCNLEKGDV